MHALVAIDGAVMTEAQMAAHVADMRRSGVDRKVVGDEGVVYLSKASADAAAAEHDKDVIAIGDGYLAQNRRTSKGRMTTREGDVVVHHQEQRFRLWRVTANGSQTPDPNVAPLDLWNRPEAEGVARQWSAESNGRIFWLQKDGEWCIVQ